MWPLGIVHVYSRLAVDLRHTYSGILYQREGTSTEALIIRGGAEALLVFVTVVGAASPAVPPEAYKSNAVMSAEIVQREWHTRSGSQVAGWSESGGAGGRCGMPRHRRVPLVRRTLLRGWE
jgi:hypothetical protein